MCVCVRVCVYIYRFSYLSCKVFPRYVIKAMILGRKLLNTKCVFLFSVQLLSAKFIILRVTEGDIAINIHRSSYKVLVVLIGIE